MYLFKPFCKLPYTSSPKNSPSCNICACPLPDKRLAHSIVLPLGHSRFLHHFAFNTSLLPFAMAKSKQSSIKGCAGRTRGSPGKRRGKKQSSIIATTSPSPSRSSGPLLPAHTSSHPLLTPVLGIKHHCQKRSAHTYTSTTTQTVESSFAAPSTPTSTTTLTSLIASSPSSPVSTASPSSNPANPASYNSRRSSDPFSVLLDSPFTTAELRDWERGIKAACSPAKRSKWSNMLQEEIRQRGIEGMGGEMVE